MKNFTHTVIVFIASISLCSGQLSNVEFQKALQINATKDANQFLEKVLSLEQQFKSDAKVTFLHGTYQYRIGKNEDAEKSYCKSIKQDSTFIQSYLGLVAINVNKKEFEKAIIIISRAIKQEDKNSKLYDIRSKIYGQMGKYDLALKDLDTKITIKNLDIKNYVEAAKICNKMNLGGKAEIYFVKAFTTDGMDIAIVDVAYAQYLMELQRYEDATLRYVDALEKNEKTVVAIDYSNLAVAYFKIENYESAVKFGTIAIKMEPLNIDYKTNLMAVLAAKKDWKKVIITAQSVLAIDKNNEIALEFLSRALLQKGTVQVYNN